MTTGLSNDVVDLLNFTLSSREGTQSLLGDLSSSLLTSVSDQLHQSSLVWSQTGNLSDDRTDKGGSLGSSTLSVRDLWDLLQLFNLSTLVETSSDTCSNMLVHGRLFTPQFEYPVHSELIAFSSCHIG